jgi:hypothetical protein
VLNLPANDNMPPTAAGERNARCYLPIVFTTDPRGGVAALMDSEEPPAKLPEAKHFNFVDTI